MKGSKLLSTWLLLALLVLVLIGTNHATKSPPDETKKPPDLKTDAIVKNKTTNNQTEINDEVQTKNETKVTGNLEDADDLIGQETIQSEVSKINKIETTTTSPTEDPDYKEYVRPVLPYYPTRYLFRFKPKTSKFKLKIPRTSKYKQNTTVSESMRKWRSRYNYIFQKLASTTKPTYLKKYYNNYLVGSESSTYSKKRKPSYRFRGGSNKLGGYGTSGRSRSRSRSSRRNRRRNRSRSSSGTLSTSGSYRSYTSRRFFPPSSHSSSSKVAVPGESEVDYPTYTTIPKTSFTCDNKVGRFPDYEARCQLWHMCYGGGLHSSFLCPNGTLFNPKVSVCDWWYMVRCE